MRRPSLFAGPQPKQEFPGAYFSCSDSFILVAGALNVQLRSVAISRARRRSWVFHDTGATPARYKASAAESNGYDRVVRRHVHTSRKFEKRQKPACSMPDRIQTS